MTDSSKSPSLLFSMNFSKGIYCKDEKIMSLTPVDSAKQIIQFTDRPVRESKYITLEQFASYYTTGSDNFSSSPPNAVFTTKINGKQVNLVIIMEQVRIKDNNLIVKLKFEESGISKVDSIKEEELLTKYFDYGSLFIDSFINSSRANTNLPPDDFADNFNSGNINVQDFNIPSEPPNN